MFERTTPILILAIAIAIALSACEKKKPEVHAYRTVYVYLAADNTLAGYETGNINQMYEGFKKDLPSNARLLAFVDARGKNSKLIEVSDKGITTLKDYGENLNGALPATFKRGFEDVKAFAPAQKYGLILWSHGSGWLPGVPSAVRSATDEVERSEFANPPFPIRPLPGQGVSSRAFGQDTNGGTNNWMSLQDMASAIPDNSFEYILFDACFMSSVELLYTLRNKCDYFIASPTEIIAIGFPYEEIIGDLFGLSEKLEEHLKSICQKFYDFYMDEPAYYRAATVALVKSRELPTLANKIKLLDAEFTPALASKVQRFHRPPAINYPCYDFTDTYTAVQGTGSTNIWSEELSKCVTFELHTEYFLGLKIDTCCGLSTYIPQTGWTITNAEYQQTEWFKDTH